LKTFFNKLLSSRLSVVAALWSDTTLIGSSLPSPKSDQIVEHYAHQVGITVHDPSCSVDTITPAAIRNSNTSPIRSGVVAHDGDAHQGHYVAAVRCKHEDDGIATISDNRELEYRHQVWTELRWPEYENVLYDPFVLFYAKI
jgi:hypothetical protein